MHAFEHAQQGDIFVQKAPASTILDLANAIQSIFNGKSEIQIIGTRHGEKLFETLVSREEMAHAQDFGNCYRIPADVRDLNYSKFYSEGEKSISEATDFTSHNTQILNVNEVKKLLLSLSYVQERLPSA